MRSSGGPLQKPRGGPPPHEPPAELEQAEEGQRDDDERERGALAREDPQRHADSHGAEPYTQAGRHQREGLPPEPGRQQAGRRARRERPERIPQPGGTAARVMVGPADGDEEQHTAEVREGRASRTHGARVVPASGRALRAYTHQVPDQGPASTVVGGRWPGC